MQQIIIAERFPFLKWLRTLILCLPLVFKPPACAAQVTSNEGKEFWVAFPTHEHDYAPNGTLALPNMSIFITSSGVSAGTVSAGSFSYLFKVTPGSVTEISIPREKAYIDESESDRILPQRAIHIKVDENQSKIVVYAHIYAAQRSAASLILPVETLGKEYLSTNFKPASPAKNFIALVATQPDTRVNLRRNGRELVPGGIYLPAAGDIYEYTAAEDLTGTRITADAATCKNFAVFSGSSGSAISSGSNCQAKTIDPLYQQCYPIKSWGQNYGVIPFSTSSPNFGQPVRTSGYHIRVIASNDDTRVTINGKQTITLQSGEFYSTELTGPLIADCAVNADKPISVVQYALSEACSSTAETGTPSGYSDPDMVILNPMEYNIRQITIFSSIKENISEQYVNILIRTTSAPSFRIDGEKPRAAFRPMTNLPGYSFLQLDLTRYSRHTFTLLADDGFNAIAYGFGKVESYAYSAGTNLAANYTLNAIRRSDQQVIDSACTDDDYYFKLTLPFAAPALSWQMDKSELTFSDLHPVFRQADQNGKTVYEYQLPKTIAYKRAGYHDIHVEAAYPQDVCNSTATQEIRGRFKVIAPPDVRIGATASACPQAFSFEDLTPDEDGQVTRSWNFGDFEKPDANYSNQVKSTHYYTNPGNYTVTLTVKNGFGCSATVLTQVSVTGKAIADLTSPPAACTGRMIYLSDASSPPPGFKPVRWTWYFGDGDSITYDKGSPAGHIYRKPGIYQASLVLTADGGCRSYSPERSIRVDPLSSGDFDLSDICVGNQALFRTKTDQAEAASIDWNFGDPAASPGNPNTATGPLVTHIYSMDGHYPVNMTLRSADGCDSTIIKYIEVASDQVNTDFSVANTCAGQPTVFSNLSGITGFGKFKRFEWTFDMDNYPEQTEIYDDPVPGQTYLHTYTLPAGRLPQQTHARLRVYTAIDCYHEITKAITLYPSPKVFFAQPGTVCLNTPPFPLSGAGEISGLSGHGFFKGAGVTPAGFFDPALAGPGLHNLSYVFLSDAGCADSLSRQIDVLNPPQINMQFSEITIISGQKVRLTPPLTPTAGLTYHWTPATGLDNDQVPSPEASPASQTTYTLTVSNGTCASSATYSVHVLRPIRTVNAFSPNGDGINDYWIISNIGDYPDAIVRIFNRYGIEIFQSRGYTSPWDGKYQGKALPAGVYYYLVVPGEGMEPVSGHVTLLR